MEQSNRVGLVAVICELFFPLQNGGWTRKRLQLLGFLVRGAARTQQHQTKPAVYYHRMYSGETRTRREVRGCLTRSLAAFLLYTDRHGVFFSLCRHHPTTATRNGSLLTRRPSAVRSADSRYQRRHRHEMPKKNMTQGHFAMPEFAPHRPHPPQLISASRQRRDVMTTPTVAADASEAG